MMSSTPRTLPALRLVLADGSTPVSTLYPAPFSQTITIPQYDNAIQPFQLFGANGSAIDATGGAFILTARTAVYNAAVLSRQGDAIDFTIGKGSFAIDSIDTGIAEGGYPADVEYIDSAGNRWQVMPPDDSCTTAGNYIITEALSEPGQLVTPAVSQLPLGSALGHSATRSAFPSAASKAWLFWIADDTGFAYYSDGTNWNTLGGGSGGLPAFVADGDAIFQSGTGGAATFVVRAITQDDIQAGFGVSASFPGTGVVELGGTVSTVSVSASYTNGPPSSATFTDGVHTNTLTSPYTSSSLTNGGPGYTSNTIGSFVFTLSAVKGGVTKSSSGTLSFQARHYWGLAAAGTYNSAFANALASSALGSSAAGSYTFAGSDGAHYLYLVVPAAGPQPTSFTSGGFSFPMTTVATSVNVTNPNGVAVPCNFYQSNPIVVGGSVVVS